MIAWYDGLDEDGDGLFLDWHEANFQPERGAPNEIAGHVGSATAPPFEVVWDTMWIPDQRPQSIRLVARLRSPAGVWSVTPIVDGLSLTRDSESVRIFRPVEIPEKFGVRVGRTATCDIPIPASIDLTGASDAKLHLRTWHGFADVHSPSKLNEHSLVLEGKNHHYDADLMPVPVSSLRSGDNTFTIQSDTKEHMLEVLWPGPELIVRFHDRPEQRDNESKAN